VTNAAHVDVESGRVQAPAADVVEHELHSGIVGSSVSAELPSSRYTRPRTSPGFGPGMYCSPRHPQFHT